MKYFSGLLFIFIMSLSLVFTQCDDKKKSEGTEKERKLRKTAKSAADFPDTLSDDEICKLSLEELMEVKVFRDTSPVIIEPSYNLPIKDLMALEIVKEVELGESLRMNYDIPLEQLHNVEIPIHQRRKGGEFIPSYAMSLEGLLAFEIVEESKIVEKVEVSYDISLDGLMRLKLTDTLAN